MRNVEYRRSLALACQNIPKIIGLQASGWLSPRKGNTQSRASFMPLWRHRRWMLRVFRDPRLAIRLSDGYFSGSNFGFSEISILIPVIRSADQQIIKFLAGSSNRCSFE